MVYVTPRTVLIQHNSLQHQFYHLIMWRPNYWVFSSNVAKYTKSEKVYFLHLRKVVNFQCGALHSCGCCSFLSQSKDMQFRLAGDSPENKRQHLVFKKLLCNPHYRPVYTSQVEGQTYCQKVASSSLQTVTKSFLGGISAGEGSRLHSLALSLNILPPTQARNRKCGCAE